MAFIVFEGGEGTGKSSQLEILCQRFKSAQLPCVKTREPGGTPLAENIRGLFKSVPAHGDIPVPKTELMLVMAARAQHFEKVIAPSVHRKEWMLCDRFLDSSYVYQAMLGGLPKEYVDAVGVGILGDFVPDLTFVFTIKQEVAQQRMKARIQSGIETGNAQEPADRLDAFEESVHARIDAGFIRLVEENWAYPAGKIPRRILINAEGSLESVANTVAAHLQNIFGISL